MSENTENHNKRRIMKISNKRNNRVFNGYDGGGVYHDYNHHTYYNPYEEIHREEMKMRIQHWIEEKRRRTTTTTVVPTTELTQVADTTPRNMTHDWFTIHLHTERATLPPRTLVDRAVLPPPTTTSSSSNSPSASFLRGMLIPIWIAVPVLLIALCFTVIMLFRAIRLRRESNARCGLQRRNAHRERREPDEWSNMIATNRTLPRQQNFDDILLDHLENIGALPHLRSAQLSNNDKPPPYSECTRSSETTSKRHVSEEPPPPYSACYVANNHSKDAEPKVHIRRQNVLDERAHSSTDIVNAQNELIENGLERDDFNITTSSNDRSGDEN